MFGYISPALTIAILTVVGVRWPNAGLLMHYLVSAGLSTTLVYLHLSGIRTIGLDHLTLTAVVLAVLGILFWYGRPRPSEVAWGIGISLPLLTIVILGIPLWRAVESRIDDGIRTARHVIGNGVDLVWAPVGRGWPKTANTWQEAEWICAHLAEDGQSVVAEPQKIWRLPTVGELVASLTRGGINAGGIWDNKTASSRYKLLPDKESPLWDTTSPIIHWWTSTEPSAAHAFAVSYSGRVIIAREQMLFAGRSFRAVRNPLVSSPLVAGQHTFKPQ
jgi:hypothetical protein